MAFFRKVVDHLLNQVLVDTLANSRWFQKFAVWSHKSVKELSEKSKDGSSVLDAKLTEFTAFAQQQSKKVREDFAQELAKIQEAMKQQELQKGQSLRGKQ